jgi:hypothetical protein
VRPLLALPLVFVPLALGACGNTYHPEYHPVTVTSYAQHVAYPAAGPTTAPPGPILHLPPPPQPPTPAPWSAWPAWPDE